MSALFNAAGEVLKRASGNVPGDSDYSCVFWFRKNTALPGVGQYNTVLVFFDDTVPGKYIGIFLYDDGTLSLDTDDGGGASSASEPTGVTADIWYPVAYTRTGSTHTLYFDGALAAIPTATNTFAAGDLPDTWIGDDGGSISDLEIKGFREYDRVLTLNELNTELGRDSSAVDNTDLWSDVPLITDADDISGNNRDFTATGAVTFIASVPTNTSRLFAETISALPFTKVIPEAPTTDLWWVYTAVPEDHIIGWWSYGDFNNYNPGSVTFQTNGTTRYLQLSGQANTSQPTYFPVVNGDTYSIRVTAPSNPDNADLNISFIRHTDVAVPAGSIVVPDNTTGYPFCVLSGTVDQTTLAYITGVIGAVWGDVLASGIYCIGGSLTPPNVASQQAYVLYDSDNNEIANDTTGTSLPANIRGNRVDKFYVALALLDTLLVVSDAGVVLSTHTINNVDATAVSPDGTILYYLEFPSTAAIKRWDLINDLPLSDLVALPSSPNDRQLLCLSDGSVIVILADDNEIRQYSDAGVLLNTYDLDPYNPAGTQTLLAYDNVSDDFFWIWNHANIDNAHHFVRVTAADGVIDRVIAHTPFNVGVYLYTGTPTPELRFGHSATCPFWLAPLASGATGTLIVEKIVENLEDPDDPTTFDIDVSGGLSPSPITLGDGDSHQYDDVPVGTYDVTEQANADYVTVYEVSNGDPHDAIEIEDGETVTVTITNKRRGSITVGKVTDPFDGEHEFNFEADGLTPNTFTLVSDDEQVFADLDPTVQYAIRELADASYFPVYLISNDSPSNEAIIVNPGEAVVIMVVNNLSAAFSGLYRIVPGKKTDTVRQQDSQPRTKGIPNPFGIVYPIRNL